MKSTTIAVDVAKSVFEIAVSHRPGRVAERHRLSRAAFLRFFAGRRPALVLLEACGSSHHWGRAIQRLGHDVLLLPPHRTRPYVTGNKNDRADAKGLLEAHRNEQIRPGRCASRPRRSPSRDPRVGAAHALGRTRSPCPGPPGSRDPQASDDVVRFPTARHFASYLGLTPRERSTGLRRRLGRISKRGDVYLRMLLTRGARAVLWKAKSREKPDRLRAWALQVEQRRGHNKAAIALANKIARVVWAVWRREAEFTEQPVVTAA